MGKLFIKARKKKNYSPERKKSQVLNYTCSLIIAKRREKMLNISRFFLAPERPGALKVEKKTRRASLWIPGMPEAG